MVTIIEESQISPPAGVAKFSLPLSLFDIPWVYCPPFLSLHFYDFSPISKSHFIDSIVPNLKHSLCLTLQHFLPFSGNLIISPNSTSNKYEICYVECDSVSVTFAECSKDFIFLTGNHAREENDFRDLVPQLSPLVTESTIIIATLAIQVTLFPDQGFSIGFAFNHGISDASTNLNFIRAWSSVTKFNGDEAFIASGSLPHYNINGLVKDPHSVATRFWEKVGEPKFVNRPRNLSPNFVRATFIMTHDQIQKLKELASIQLPKVTRLSSFTVVCAYIWSCIAKLRLCNNLEVDKDEIFTCPAEFRSRLDPPLPPTYFGNCILPCAAISRTTELGRENGFFKAAELIAGGISERVESKNDPVLEGMELFMRGMSIIKQDNVIMLAVSGSPKFNFYDTDFGWGRPRKCEVVSLMPSGLNMSLSSTKEYEREIEIGLCFTKTDMDTFENIFSSGLKSLLVPS